MTTNSLITLLLDEHKKCEELIRENFSSLKSDQINWKPSPESWSIAECFEHLIRTNREYFPQLKTSINSLKHLTEDAKFNHTILGKFILNAIKPSNKRKTKTPKKFNPVYNSEVNPDVIKMFLRQYQSLKDFLMDAKGLDLTKAKIISPFNKLIKYNLGDSFSIMVYHNQRHIQQAVRVKNLEIFSK